MSNTPELILQLVETFDRNIDNFKKQNYNEAQVRQQFINPFFEALGWDMQNKAGIALAYSDVIHEDAIKIGSATKAPDYCFRIGGTRKFFLEAKKPSVDIKSDVSPAYQLRRYAWSAKLPLSILTDFEEFAVYDCQIRPNVNDKPSTARIFFCGYKEYGDKWEQIAKIFSKDAVLKGLFDKYASEKTTKRGTTTVDKEFLAEIEEWRNELAKNIAIRNGKLSVYDLNFAVQKTIDRILFLRICEDRGIERSEQLLGLINGSRIYPRLFELFEKADERYNSGIFHFRREKDRPEEPDELSANLKVDDDVLKKVIKDLYYPCPYEFSVMPAEILGNVYEQFLGKVIRLTESHQAKVEEKPEVKKAGGVYYTPSYIVDYIVKNTVGKLCEGKTPKQIEKLKILDPACGSGSFLIGAYQCLLDFHRDYYAKLPAKYKKQIYQGKGGQWYLTIDEKKKILLNNIYGVDIDSQAVEVTKLSLLLKVLENETQESLRLFHERALPDLGNNIKCGNSLIGHDFYQNQQRDLFGEEEKHKINAFDWQAEFPEIFKLGGFNAVIGNPPYVAFQEGDKLVKQYYKKYKSATGKYDLYILFVEKSLWLLKEFGIFSFIIPNKFIHSDYGKGIKEVILNNQIIEIVDFNDIQVFSGATNYPCIMVIKKSSLINSFQYRAVVKTETPGICFNSILINQKSLSNSTWLLIEHKYEDLLNKIKNNKPVLAELSSAVTQGLRTGHLKIFFENINLEFIKQNRIERELVKPVYHGKNIKRYSSLLDNQSDLIIFPYANDFKSPVDIDKYPNAHEYLLRYKKELGERKDSGQRFKNTDKIWYEYWDPKPICFKSPKIVFPDISNQNNFYLDLEGIGYLNTCYGIFLLGEINYYYILGILNSKVIEFFIKKISPFVRGGFYRYKTKYIEQLPIRTIDFNNKYDVAKHDRMVSLVEQMLDLQKALTLTKTPDEKTRLQRQIDSTDSQIDKLVYELYGLTDEEIRTIEE